ncbi:MAG: citrate synthase [Anaerotruncus sp.]|nr:citrate synthase [Anaerotruncus sp.]
MHNKLPVPPDPQLQEDIKLLCDEYMRYNPFQPELYNRYNVKRGLRNADGTGVLAGITQICNVHGYLLNEGEKVPIDGELIYRGINIQSIIHGCRIEGRFCFEETAYLLLQGRLPNSQRLDQFNHLLAEARELPTDFTEDIIMKVASPNIMNMLARSVLALYTYDYRPEDTSVENVMRQSIELIARMPSIMAAAYQVKRRIYDGRSMYLHNPNPEFSTAQNILRMLRSDKQFTDEEAQLLDLCLMLHSDHGGGNNSTFAVRVLTSSGTDTYSAISAGIGSLKGPRHGGANFKVIQQLEMLKENIKNWEDDAEIASYLRRVVNKQAGDGSGLIYGMGHAVYTKSDPREKILKENAVKLAKGTDFEGEFQLLDAVERLSPDILREKWGSERSVCANIDLYSGLVYRMLGIPDELHTPLFAIARTSGWSAHRLEELCTNNRIIRPAYKPISTLKPYVPLGDR